MGEIVVPPDGCAVGKKIVELNIPKSTIITMIKRKDKYIIPDGSTEIQADDLLIILSDYYRNIDSVRDNLCILNT